MFLKSATVLVSSASCRWDKDTDKTVLSSTDKTVLFAVKNINTCKHERFNFVQTKKNRLSPA